LSLRREYNVVNETTVLDSSHATFTKSS